MSSYPKLSFAEMIRPDGAEFPQCCTSGFFMTYNTHLRDPLKHYFAQQSQKSAKSIVRSGLSRAKKKSTRK